MWSQTTNTQEEIRISLVRFATARIDYLLRLIVGTAIDYNYYTVPQKNLSDRILPYHRGRALGGSSTTNGLYYGRGSASVYDKWVELGNPGWGWDDLYPGAIKVSFDSTIVNVC
jgi:choline dehydrogenase-like flavoprotein